MNRVFRNPEYRFVVPGRAVSFRSPKARVYKSQVQEAARPVIVKPLPGLVEIRIDYFHHSHRKMDMDNIAKCIMDALNGLAYNDDRQARLQTSRAHDLSVQAFIPDGPVDLIKPLRDYGEYVFVRVRDVST
jgi:Holliday junction resolvase RusA-like endonuclease